METDRLAAAIEALDAGDRALLELSLRQGVADETLAELLGLEVAEVGRRRRALLDRLAGALEVEGEDAAVRVEGAIAALGRDDWAAAGGAEPRRGQPIAPAVPEIAEPERDGVEPEAAEPEAREAEPLPVGVPVPIERIPPRRRAVVFLLPIAVFALVATGVIALAAGDDADRGREQERGEAAPGPAEEGEGEQPGGGEPAGGGPEPAVVRLRPVGDVPEGAGGRARIVGTGDEAELELRVSGLRRIDATYEVWLFDSVVDAVSLGSFEGPRFSLDAELPPGALDFQFIDVSREPPDDVNVNHSGVSLLRVRIEALLEAGG